MLKDQALNRKPEAYEPGRQQPGYDMDRQEEPAQLKKKQCNLDFIFFVSISYFQEVNPDIKDGGSP